jgi:hypothetical protein
LNEVYGVCEKTIENGEYKIVGVVKNEEYVYVNIEKFEKS